MNFTIEQQEEQISSMEVYIQYLKSKVNFLEHQIEDMRNNIHANTTNYTNYEYHFYGNSDSEEEEDNEPIENSADEFELDIDVEEIELVEG